MSYRQTVTRRTIQPRSLLQCLCRGLEQPAFGTEAASPTSESAGREAAVRRGTAVGPCEGSGLE